MIAAFGDTRLSTNFWDKAQPCPMSGCWLWVGAFSRGDYGTFGVRGRMQLAHRVSYQAFIGAIAPDLEIDHICKVRCCCNPDHLRQVTHTENMANAIYPNREKTHCPSGHEYDDANTFYRTSGKTTRRGCRTCNRVACNARARRNNARTEAA